jgi:TPP-dependent pyruvate/acetoin dehydrogenase alpha subunit
MPPRPQDRCRFLDLHRTVARIRAFEELVALHFRAGDIHGFVHISTGQEAVAAGACAALRPDDMIATTHRGHGHCIAKGADPVAMMAELFGRESGLCRGKGGSMHIADPAIGILGANGIVGAGIPIAVGAALSSRLLRTGSVTLVFFGEGAVHCGAFHEGITLAVAWSVPVVFVCENNGYAEFTRSDRWGGPTILERAQAYGMPATAVDGNDPVLVEDVVREAVERARSGHGPVFVEAKTTRASGHYEGDPQRYRPSNELDGLGDRDPLVVMRLRLDDPEEAGRIETAAEDEMKTAVRIALDEPYPELTAVTTHVFG